jgi:neutral ceramidase
MAWCVVVVAAGAAAGCTQGDPLEIAGYRLKPPTAVSGFVAGAAAEEITPYPGIPLGGHGPGGRIARGTWMPIYARAFYFQDRTGHAAAMVSCDLFAVSAGLRAEVLRLVNRETRLEPGALILSATHTHHGPANFASAGAYNGFGGPLPNFDEDVFRFLAHRIARAVVAAIDDAHKHAADDHELRLYAGYAIGIQRNRAIAPFYANDAGLVRSVQEDSYAAGSRCPDNKGRNCPRYLSTDPTLKVLEIRRRGQRRALLTFYAVHPTAMTHDNELYSPDLAGVAMKTLERENGVVAAFFNGAEGDVSPDWDRQDRDDVLTLGGKLASAITNVLGTPPVQAGKPTEIITLWNHAQQNTSGWPSQFTKPTPGAGEPGGAEDGRTVFYNYGLRGEARNRKAPDPKLSVLGRPVKDLVDGLELEPLKLLLGFVKGKPEATDFPLEFPVCRLKLGGIAEFVTIPVEATTLVGRGIRESINRDAIVLGLTNEYFGYTVTPAEYMLQQYEGGSTELGKQEADGIAYLLGHVAADSASDVVPAQTFMPGTWRDHHFGPNLTLLRLPRNMVDDDLEPLLTASMRRMEPRIPRFAWRETILGDRAPERRRVSIRKRDGTVVAEDRTSPDFLTVIDGAGKIQRHYAALWIAADGATDSTAYYFKVETGDKRTVCSDSFTRAALPAAVPVPPIKQAACPR